MSDTASAQVSPKAANSFESMAATTSNVPRVT
eukprot:CAMPEP_0184451244 /NCGR_PEP_ID=MMETSP0740-20130409/6302_1 /TAXON_ID=385413 /ORGANISM="Thalassiosira miniscula, Strain CCMP1093" /LENGTH=31 /DNA_ID= /DNA_START= /DNA_END= /DNA_ORIENTATION=